MPINAKHLARGLYSEVWVGNITTDQVLLSAAERQEWRRIDGDKEYCVLIDLSKCVSVPIKSVLLKAAGVHPRKKVHFIIYNNTIPLFGLLAGFVRAIGYHVDLADTYADAVVRGEKVLALHRNLAEALVGAYEGDTKPIFRAEVLIKEGDTEPVGGKKRGIPGLEKDWWKPTKL